VTDYLRNRISSSRAIVLMLDERDDTRALFALALSAMGFQVVAARDSAEAYRRASTIHPDIVVTDLPGADGDRWQLVLDLKSDTRTRDIPVIAISPAGQRSFRERATHDDVEVDVVPPCEPDQLAHAIRLVLARDRTGRSSPPDNPITA
jgi:two-component system, OmpR family, phosphate regulon response regulator PhoB